MFRKVIGGQTERTPEMELGWRVKWLAYVFCRHHALLFIPMVSKLKTLLGENFLALRSCPSPAGFKSTQVFFYKSGTSKQRSAPICKVSEAPNNAMVHCPLKHASRHAAFTHTLNYPLKRPYLVFSERIGSPTKFIYACTLHEKPSAILYIQKV